MLKEEWLWGSKSLRHDVIYEYEIVDDPFIEGGYAKAIRYSWLFGREVEPRRGKVRDIYYLGDHLLLFHTDRISAFDVVMKDLIPYKGIFLTLLSAYWFSKTRKICPNHFVEQLNERTLKVVRAERINIEWIIRGYLYGSAWRAYRKGIREISGVKLPNGLQLAEELPEPILTPTTKSEKGHDREISKDEAIAMGLVTREEWNEIEETCFKLYEFYQKEARKVGLIIADVKLEFGRYNGTIIQIDEPPTHDSARIWLEKYYEPGRTQERYCLDKEFLREYLRRIGYNGEGEPPRLPKNVIKQVALRVKGAYEVLVGLKSADEIDVMGLDEVLKGDQSER